jgi:hypothetical protein
MLGTEFESANNWGHPGLGNRAIAERVAEAHAHLNLQPEDVVIVQWTSHLRHDWMHTRMPRIDGSAWQTKGSIFSEDNQKLFGRKWMETFWDEKAYFIQNLNHILLTQGLLNSVGCTWYMTSMSDLTKISTEVSPKTVDGELPSPDVPLQDVWTIARELLPYKHAIWDKYPGQWIPPMLDICNATMEEYFVFQYDPTNPKEDKEKVHKERWIEPHPSVNQHALWVLQFKKMIGEKAELTPEQQALVDGFNQMKSETKTYKQFESRIHETMWYVTNRYRGV